MCPHTEGYMLPLSSKPLSFRSSNSPFACSLMPQKSCLFQRPVLIQESMPSDKMHLTMYSCRYLYVHALYIHFCMHMHTHVCIFNTQSYLDSSVLYGESFAQFELTCWWCETSNYSFALHSGCLLIKSFCGKHELSFH